MNYKSQFSSKLNLVFTLMMRCRELLPKTQSFAFGQVSTYGKEKIQHIYVINLDRKTDRLIKIERELRSILDNTQKELWYLTERYSAIDASSNLKNLQMEYDVNPNYTLAEQLYVEPQPLALPSEFLLNSSIRMSDPEIAIAQSHIELWRQLAASKYDYTLILEDDVWFRRGFANKLDTAWSEIHSQKDKTDFDILYLSYEEVKNGAPKTFITKHVFKPTRGLWFLSGYVLSRAGAEKLLKLLPCKGPVDLWLNHQFKSLNVLALRNPIISQRRDLGSTNSYSILPSLTKIGAINSERSASFNMSPTEQPVFVFGPENSGLSSIAMALAMLGYRCCSDLDILPDKEKQLLLNGSNNRIFNAYINIGSLTDEIHSLIRLYPQAKFIITKGELQFIEEKDLNILQKSNTLDLILFSNDATNKWQLLCEHLRCPPPMSSFPNMEDLGQRKVIIHNTAGYPALKWHIRNRDKSPWIIGQNKSWQGIVTATSLRHSEGQKNNVSFKDNLNFHDSNFWIFRDDTFTDNMAIFQPSNIKLLPEHGAALILKKESLGVREYSAAALTSSNLYVYGRFDAVVKVSNVPGVVTGIFLHRDSPRQEIDIEIAGNRTDRLLANVFYNPGSNGAKFDYGYRGTPVVIDLGFDASEDFHLYSIEWKPNEISWFVDNCLVHKRYDWNPTPIPHLPMAFHINIWPTRSKELAGRLALRKLPTRSYVKSVEIKATQSNLN